MAKDKFTKRDNRNLGYMTAEEFVDTFTPGLKEYLGHNWGKDKQQLLHPMDLMMNTQTYFEIGGHVLSDFMEKCRDQYEN